MRNIPSLLILISLSRDRSFHSTPKIGHELAKQPVTIDRNHRSRLSEMTGHDGPKYAANLSTSLIFPLCHRRIGILVKSLPGLYCIWATSRHLTCGHGGRCFKNLQGEVAQKENIRVSHPRVCDDAQNKQIESSRKPIQCRYMHQHRAAQIGELFRKQREAFPVMHSATGTANNKTTGLCNHDK